MVTPLAVCVFEAPAGPEFRSVASPVASGSVPATSDAEGLRVGFVQTDRPGVSSLLFGQEDLGVALGMLLDHEQMFDLVVLPEAVTASELEAGSPELASVQGVSREVGDAVLAVGVVDRRTERNSLRLLSSSADLGRYDKVNLVPGSERKFSWLPGFDDWMGFERGSGPVIVTGPGFRAGALICYDIGDSSMVRGYALAGADVLLLSSSTGRLADQVGAQQLLVARVRALESGLPVALSSRGGPSALVSADGSLLDPVERHATGVGAGVLIGGSRAPFDPLWPQLLFGAVFVLLLGVTLSSRRR
jgi:apolipoprotein N-acyltransferase